MNREDIYKFIRAHKYGVLSTVTPDARPEAALVGIAVAPTLEIVFDSINTNRKCRNLERNPHIAFVIGWENERTLQLEGVADIPRDEELERVANIYREAWPQAGNREMWPGHVYWRVRPKWLRLSSYQMPYQIDEMNF